jgi:hypothetical protein
MKRVLRSIYGQYVGTADDFRLLAQQGIITGPWGAQMPQGDLLNYVNYDDFDGATLLGTWGVLKGTDGAAANFACNGGIGGTVLGTTGATTTTMAGSGIQITSHLNLKAQGAGGATALNNLELDVRLQTSLITGLCLFVGFTNQVAALQMPVQGSGAGNALTVIANDCVGWLYDTTMSTPAWYCVGVKAGVVAPLNFSSGGSPVAATYDQLHVSVDQLGNANFWRNSGGNVLSQSIQQPAASAITLANAVTPTVALAPVVAAFDRIAASKNITIDYIMASMNRI